MSISFETDINHAIQLDRNDPLKEFRKRFYIENDDTIYADGNSLGRLPVKTKELVQEVTEKQWGAKLIESWNRHWYEKSGMLGDKIAQIIGASEGEVIVTDSTSVNLYKLAHAAIKFQKDKTRIVSDAFNFPTDLYILQGLVKEAGPAHELALADSKDGITIDMNDLKEKINEDTSLVVLSMVSFKSSFLYNAKEITAFAHKKGALVLWDLSHAAGAVPVELNKINADLAVGCTYKFLNGGPGSPAYLYVRKDLQEMLSSPIQGWFGDDRPFEFNLRYRPAKGIRKFLTGTPPVISQMAIEPGLDIMIEAGMENIHKKSRQQSEYFIFLVQNTLLEIGFQLGSPLDPAKRGSHVSLKHPEAYRICQALINPPESKQRIIPDFREPDNIRIGITPLYTTYQELWQIVQQLKEVVLTKEFLVFPKERNTVT